MKTRISIVAVLSILASCVLTSCEESVASLNAQAVRRANEPLEIRHLDMGRTPLLPLEPSNPFFFEVVDKKTGKRCYLIYKSFSPQVSAFTGWIDPEEVRYPNGLVSELFEQDQTK